MEPRHSAYDMRDQHNAKQVRRRTMLGIVDDYSFDIRLPRDSASGIKMEEQGGGGPPPPGPLAMPHHHELSPMDRLADYVPLVSVLRNYSSALAAGDFRAGLTIGVVMVLRSIVFATLANVSVSVSLVSSIVPVTIYALLGTSRQLSVGPEALAAVLIGQTVAEELEVATDGVAANQIAAVMAFLVGIIALVLSLARAGFLDSVLTGFVKTGFISSVGILIAIEQLPEITGINLALKPRPTASTFEKLVVTSKAILASAHGPSIAVGVTAVIFMLAAKQIKARVSRAWVKAVPEIVVLVVIMIAISAATDFPKYGIRTLGKFDNRFPTPGLPKLSMDRIQRLVTGALIQTVVGFVESMAVSKDLGMQYGYNPRPNRELFALGSANLIGSFVGCFVSMGSLPRSKILADSGGRTNVASLWTAAWVTVFVFTAGPILKFLPLPTLAGFVAAAALNLIHVSEIVFVMRVKSWGEIIGMLGAFAATFFWNVESGALAVLFAAMLLIVRRSVGIDMAILGRRVADPVSHKKEDSDQQPQQPQQQQETVVRYVDIRDHADAALLDNVLVLSVRSPLVFFNSGNISVTVDRLLKAQTALTDGAGYKMGKGRQTIVFDMENCPAVDAAAAFLLIDNTRTFLRADIRVIFSGLNPQQRALYDASGLTDVVGANCIYGYLEEAVAAATKIGWCSNGGS
ncbi:Solute carrier 26 [Geranomyces variabilis]|uniref:Solute carrier 26 n=1 Tax=Geranomyces variabilis TaxID=109894 RepID=A0AAD5XVE1_9FUNG|nr:Solute carrier 26 [Geranomyces variabilis]